jgi:hypothetical protein
LAAALQVEEEVQQAVAANQQEAEAKIAEVMKAFQ